MCQLCTGVCSSSPGVSVQWQVNSYTVSEDSGTVQLVLLKEGPTVSNVSVEVMTVASSATGMTGQAHQTNYFHNEEHTY